jgi:hypothetical protein
MNKLATLFGELHHAETDLADAFRERGERHGADHDIWHMCHQLGEQADARAEQIRLVAQRYDVDLKPPRRSDTAQAVAAGVRHKASEILGRRPEGGMLLLSDLRQLFLAAQAVNVYWLVAGQVAQALRDAELMDLVTPAHKQVLTQVKWLKTRLKETSPQVLCVS